MIEYPYCEAGMRLNLWKNFLFPLLTKEGVRGWFFRSLHLKKNPSLTLPLERGGDRKYTPRTYSLYLLLIAATLLCASGRLLAQTAANASSAAPDTLDFGNVG